MGVGSFRARFTVSSAPHSGGSKMNRVKRRSKYSVRNADTGKALPRAGTKGFTVPSNSKQGDNAPQDHRRAPGTAPNPAAAERASEHLRLSANPETFNPECPTTGGLIDRYIEQILRPRLDVPLGGVQDSAAPMSFQCAKSYKSALNRWVRPHWEDYRLQDFNKPAVRATSRNGCVPYGARPRTPTDLLRKWFAPSGT